MESKSTFDFDLHWVQKDLLKQFAIDATDVKYSSEKVSQGVLNQILKEDTEPTGKNSSENKNWFHLFSHVNLLSEFSLGFFANRRSLFSYFPRCDFSCEGKKSSSSWNWTEQTISNISVFCAGGHSWANGESVWREKLLLSCGRDEWEAITFYSTCSAQKVIRPIKHVNNSVLFITECKYSHPLLQPSVSLSMVMQIQISHRVQFRALLASAPKLAPIVKGSKIYRECRE